ncbi:hypothetical protein [Falsiroseomonas sp.]|uniref:hypothetical protein n=1 Tax=Falsiroseomonas sp. TaxID=2870721 RepID=UPI00356B1A6D
MPTPEAPPRTGLRLAALALSAMLSAGPARAQEMAGSLEAGLQALARGLAGAVGSQRPPVLSVMPFPGADQACPLLSVFVVDELTTALVIGVQPRPRLVERLQLETVVAQYRLDDFLTDPEQRRRLGGLTGIDALVVGSFVVIGDRLRINARVVGIDSGELITAQAVSVPRTGELAEMLRQPSGRGRNCVTAAAPAAVSSDPGSQPVSPPMSASACKEQFGLRLCVAEVQRNGRDAKLTLAVENASPAALGVLLVGPRPTLRDAEGGVLTATGVDGLPACGGYIQHSYMQPLYQPECLRPSNSYANQQDYLGLAPGSRLRATFYFRSEAASAEAPVALNLVMGVLPQPRGSTAAATQRRQANPLFLTLDDLDPAGLQRQ